MATSLRGKAWWLSSAGGAGLKGCTVAAVGGSVAGRCGVGLQLADWGIWLLAAACGQHAAVRAAGWMADGWLGLVLRGWVLQGWADCMFAPRDSRLFENLIQRRLAFGM